jgi:hypothetical protein
MIVVAVDTHTGEVALGVSTTQGLRLDARGKR